MLGSTHGTLTTTSRPARVVACGERPGPAVHGMAAPGPEDTDVSGRPLCSPVPDLDRFFRPEAVAVIGASETEGRPNTGITRQLIAWAGRVGARVHPVHPTRTTVFGLPCHASLRDLPEQIDLAVLLVGDPAPVLEELREYKVKFAVVFASGFAETGDEGAAAQARLAAALQGTGIRMLGPNTNLNAFEHFRDDLDGPAIALITQSGHQGRPVFALQELGIRLSHWAPTGNEADLECADFISYFATRPEVGAIAAYIEGLKDGRAFLLAADRAARNKVPVVAVKVGRTETGARTAATHTGKLTGADDVVDAAIRQFGVIRVNGLDELQDTAALLARARPPRATGVAVYSISGGTGAHFADLATAAGLELPALSMARQRQLHQWIPGYLSVANPIDNGGHPVGDWRGRKNPRRAPLRPLHRHPRLPDHRPLPAHERQARPRPRGRRGDHGQADLRRVGLPGRHRGRLSHHPARLLARGHLPHLRQLHHRHPRLPRPPPLHHRLPVPLRRRAPPPLPVRTQGRTTAAPGEQLSEHAAKQLLRAYGIRVPREQLVTSAAAAVRAAALVGYPIVVKASGPQLAHKSELGLVKIGLTSASQVRDAYRELADIARYEQLPLDGILICQMVGRGVEMAVGITHDRLFGPTVTVGLGGVLVEVLDDTAVRVPPFGEDHARAMIGELRGRALLSGVRGAPRPTWTPSSRPSCASSAWPWSWTTASPSWTSTPWWCWNAAKAPWPSTRSPSAALETRNSPMPLSPP
ncbi:hypothetical protein GCM10020000_46390 [Streptomyces olivoverticillatus]